MIKIAALLILGALIGTVLTIVAACIYLENEDDNHDA